MRCMIAALFGGRCERCSMVIEVQVPVMVLTNAAVQYTLY